jgi:hypothetical protein
VSGIHRSRVTVRSSVKYPANVNFVMAITAAASEPLYSNKHIETRLYRARLDLLEPIQQSPEANGAEPNPDRSPEHH